MRVLRLAFVILLAIVLIGVALANRQMVTVNLFPAQFGQYLGGTWSLTMPAFIAFLLVVMFGVVIGLIWEWLREAGMRAELSRRAAELARLEREVGHLRPARAGKQDEVLAILDTASTKPAGAGSTAVVPAAGR
ncbi:LapA family protein [Paracoccus aminophilus]|uniref:Lipopolysaccharide assembly protein A domain-containing protein n=1 Tax=Paracoccus aminophilus JCM 7686 TaxID=1367847 RepID=S5XY61_PARAH|nr:LapA family protein [Paracoccus aminophilus]AGT08390.1 hypothetical protein JCM7686_1289 [Paracoccus aminophilus JCM 7686]